MIPVLSWEEVLLRLALAAVLAGAIGIEREIREREAGLRTHMLVALGSALFTITSAYGFRDFLVQGGSVVQADPTRIAAQIVTGIGFLGAGAIIRQGVAVRGLTTAATLWAAAAIGLAAGAGYYSAAVMTTIVAIVLLWPLRIVTRHYFERPHEHRLAIQLAGGGSASTVLEALERLGVKVGSFDISDETSLDLLLDVPRGIELDVVIRRLIGVDVVRSARWHTD